MKNEDFKHNEFQVMTRLWAIYKNAYQITAAADLEQAVQELRRTAAELGDAPLAGPFAIILICDLERQAMENSGGDQTKTRSYALGKIFAWYNQRALADPRTYSDDDWEAVVEECGGLYKLSNERFVHDAVLTLVTDLETMSRGGRHT